jgi:hypothetical protein
MCDLWSKKDGIFLEIERERERGTRQEDWKTWVKMGDG